MVVLRGRGYVGSRSHIYQTSLLLVRGFEFVQQLVVPSLLIRVFLLQLVSSLRWLVGAGLVAGQGLVGQRVAG